MWGRKDPLVPIRFERHVRETLPQAQHLELDCGHVPQLERPKETHAALSRFLVTAAADAEPGPASQRRPATAGAAARRRGPQGG